MKINCPHCSASLGIDEETQRVLATLESFDCPVCAKPILSPVKATPAKSSSVFRSLNRNARILGAAAILVIGGIAVFLATREKGSATVVIRKIDEKTIHNEFFTRLVESGATTFDALRSFERIAPHGDGYVGFSADALTEEEARALAARTGGEILDLAKAAAASRKELTEWLAGEIPESHGLAAWALDEGKAIGIDAPDILSESDSRCRWRVFVSWQVSTGWENRGWSWVIQADFDETLPFSKWGLAAVRSGNKWGLINEAGEKILPIRFDEISNFSQHGCARVSLDGKWGLVDRRGKMIAQPEWEDVQDQLNGFIPVKRGAKWGYLNEKGNLATPCQWDDAWRFSPEGFAVVTRAGKRGMIDHNGKTILNTEWDGAVNFSKEGLGLVRRGSGWGLVNTAGQILHPPTLDIHWRDRRWDLGFLPHASGYIGRDGKPVDDDRTRRYNDDRTRRSANLAALEESFHDGLARVDVKSGSGFIDPLGEWIIEPKDFFCRDFHNGYAAATKNGKWGLMNRKGALVMDFTWDEVKDVSDGMLAVRKGTSWGFCAPDGKILVQPAWDELRPFREGVAAVKLGEKWGFIDLSGKVVAEPQWPTVNDFTNGLAAVSIKPTQEQMEAVPSYLRSRARSRDSSEWEPGFWSFIDQSGKPALGGKVWFDHTSASGPVFGNGILTSNLVGKRGIRHIAVDREGREVDAGDTSRPPSFPGAAPPFGVSSGLRLKREPRGRYLDRYGLTDKQLHLADREGKQMVKAFNPQQNPFADHIPYAEPPKYGLFNISRRALAEPRWDDIRILSPDRVRVMRNGKYGLADGIADTLIQPEWDELEVLAVKSSSIARDGKTLLFGYGKQRANDDSPIVSPWVRVRKGDSYKILRDNGQPAIPDSMPNASYLDFYGPEHVVILEKTADGKVLRSLYHPATGAKISFPGADTLHFNWSIALHGFIWERVTVTGQLVWRLRNIKKDIPEHTQPSAMEPLGWGFMDGLAPLKKEDGFIFIGLDGKPMTQDRWVEARGFSEGLAAVRRDGKWGFIGTDGASAIAFDYDDVLPFSRGLAAAKQGELWGFIDKKGNWSIKPSYREIRHSFTEWRGISLDDDPTPPVMEVALVVSEQSKDILLVDRGGRPLLVPTRYLRRASETTYSDSRGLHILIRRRGEPEVVNFKWQDATDRSGWMLVDEQGKPLVNSIWQSQQGNIFNDPFSKNFMINRSPANKLGIIRPDGSFALEQAYDEIVWIAPGIAVVWNRGDGGLLEVGGNWLFKDVDDRRIARFNAEYEGHPANSQFRHGLVVIEDKPRWGYIRLNRAESR